MKVKTNFGEYDVYPVIGKYGNGNLAIQLFDSEDDEPFATLTTNIVDLPYKLATIDTNNCPWAEDFLNAYGLIVDEWFPIMSGYCTYPVYQLDLQKLEYYEKEATGLKKYTFRVYEHCFTDIDIKADDEETAREKLEEMLDSDDSYDFQVPEYWEYGFQTVELL